MGGTAGGMRAGTRAGHGKVFISHAHEDNARCAPLLAALRRWGVDYWFDTESITGGQDLSRGIQTAIAERDVLLRICTPAAQRSYWVQLETGAFRALQAQEHHDGRDRRLLVNVILDSGYRREPFDLASLYIDATNRPEAQWLEELRRALGIAAPDAPVIEAAPAAPAMEAVSPHEATKDNDTPASRVRMPARPGGTTRARADGRASAPWLAWQQRAPARRAGLLAAMSVALLVAAFVGLLGLNGQLPRNNSGGQGSPSAILSATATATIAASAAATPTPVKTPTPVASNTPCGSTINMDETNFSVASCTVKRGAPLTFANVGASETHIICGGRLQSCEATPGIPDAMNFPKAITLQPGQKSTVTFTQDGVFSITCLLHDGMDMSIRVEG